MENFEFQNITKIIFGKGTVNRLGEEAAALGKKVLLCTGTGSIKRIGLYQDVMDQLKKQGIEVFEVSGIQPNPKITSVYEGVELCKKNDIDFILAVGGGSTIDCAKAIAAGAKSEHDAWDFFLKDEDIVEALPLCSILTLPATGTEMNGNSVVSKWDTKEKLPIYGPAIFPKFSILDPELTFSIPKEHTVNGTIDIVIHVLEQYFTKTPDTPLQDRISEGIILTVVENIFKVLKNPKDYTARANIMFCGTLANNHLVGVGKEQDWASHLIEHELSAIYDIPHGAGLSIVYPNWMKYVMKKDPMKFKQFALRVWDIDPKNKTDLQIAEEGADKLREFFSKMDAPATLAEVGIDTENISKMAKQAVRFGPIGGFQKLEAADVEKILNMCLETK